MSVVNAGLPNIIGYIQVRPSNNAADLFPGAATGAFKIHKREGVTYPTAWQEATGGTPTDKVMFSASLSNSVYGSSITVQPPAITLIPQLRY